MLEVDGSLQSGSGTVLRYSLMLASILKKGLHIKNIRAKRKKPGLQPQHLKGIEALCRLTGGSVENARVGSREIIFRPGREIRHGTFFWDIGTAGSTTMIAQALLPLAIIAKGPSTYKIIGGLFQDFAPNAYHMKFVLMGLLERFGVESSLNIVKPGYVPIGGGVIEVHVKPVKDKLKPLKLSERGRILKIRGIALSSHLKEKSVGERMARECSNILEKKGYSADIEVVNDTVSDQKGASLCIWTTTDTGCVIGSDMAGKLGRTSEEIGRRVAERLIEDIESGATVDRFTQDQLVIYASLAEGETEYKIVGLGDHLKSNLWLVKEHLGVAASIEDNIVKIKGIGLI